eukprot:g69494.t1
MKNLLLAAPLTTLSTVINMLGTMYLLLGYITAKSFLYWYVGTSIFVTFVWAHHTSLERFPFHSCSVGEVSRDGTSVDQYATARRAPFQRALSSTIFSDSHRPMLSRVFSSSLFSPPVHVAAQHTSAENSSDNAAGPAQQIGQITSFSNFWAGLVSGSSIGRNDRERQASSARNVTAANATLSRTARAATVTTNSPPPFTRPGRTRLAVRSYSRSSSDPHGSTASPRSNRY